MLLQAPMQALICCVVLLVVLSLGLDDGLAKTPPMAWTSWNLVRFEVNATFIQEMAQALEFTGLKALGWDTLQIDEGWEACAEYGPHDPTGMTNCRTPAPRDSNGRIVANSTK